MKNKFPHIKQHDAMDCGPACLAMVAKYYGKIYTLQGLREKSFITRQGASLLLFLALDRHVLNGRASISYDAKRGRFNSGFLDADLHLFKNWRLQSQLNYDFLVRRLSCDFFLVKKSGRILFRVTYRTISRQFLIELIPG